MRGKIRKKSIIILCLIIASLMSGQTVFADADGNTVEVGIETVSDYSSSSSPIKKDLPATKSIADSIYNAFKTGSAKGWGVQFDYRNTSVWETDFTTSSNGGYDSTYADDVDLLFYAGHGVMPGSNYGSTDYSFLLSTNKNSYFAERGKMQIGDRDLEWLVTFTCNFLNSDNKNIGRMAKGVHAICGYQTDMTMTNDAGSIFAQACKEGVSVKEAYFRYGRNTQVASYQNIVAVFTTTNNVNDRLWGYGSQGSDPVAYTTNSAGYITYSYHCNW